MEKNKNKWRGRPKKDFWELKEKINQEAIENKWKFKRWRPRKIQETTKNIVEETYTENKFAYKVINKESPITNTNNSKAEQISKKFLYCCVIFFLISIGIFLIQKYKERNMNKLQFSETSTNTTETTTDINNNNVTLEIWYNDNSWNFVWIEKLDTSDIENETENKSIPKNNDENITLIETFYKKINKKEFDSIKSITDKYLKENNSFKTYFNANRLTNFLNKIHNHEIYVSNIKEVEYNKENVQRYIYDIKYILNSDQKLHQEQRQIDVVNRNWEHLIWSIMCITTWCSRMPFFQK